MRTISLYRDARKWKLLDFTDGDDVIFVDTIAARNAADAIAQAARIVGVKPAALKPVKPGAEIFQAKVKPGARRGDPR